eukprot:2932888-Pyramimonas_sp.AAC.1
MRARQASKPRNTAAAVPTKYASPKKARQSPSASTARTAMRPMRRTSAVPTAGLIGQPWSRPRSWSTSWAGRDPPPATWR